MRKEFEDLIGKRFYIVLKSNREYTGVIKSVDNDIVFIIDKFGKPVYFSFSEISSMEEV